MGPAHCKLLKLSKDHVGDTNKLHGTLDEAGRLRCAEACQPQPEVGRSCRIKNEERVRDRPAAPESSRSWGNSHEKFNWFSSRVSFKTYYFPHRPSADSTQSEPAREVPSFPFTHHHPWLPDAKPRSRRTQGPLRAARNPPSPAKTHERPSLSVCN